MDAVRAAKLYEKCRPNPILTLFVALLWHGLFLYAGPLAMSDKTQEIKEEYLKR